MGKQELPFKHYQHPDKFGDWLGYEVTVIDYENNSAELALKLREDHLSLAGRVHGGVVSSYLDFSCGAAVFTTMHEKDVASTVELKVNYFKPLEIGKTLFCKSKIIHSGNRLRTAQALLFVDQEKEPVAMATATFYVLKPKKQST